MFKIRYSDAKYLLATKRYNNIKYVSGNKIAALCLGRVLCEIRKCLTLKLHVRRFRKGEENTSLYSEQHLNILLFFPGI
jgi:hypothetical protein